ncbi:PilZ domain-containing protein [Qipengyuania marisflavi]|uniref:PilZ domain-containing protein n=1 Tax=Qipengyuania marisflavi TaxID=2486356 RepID=A0A5S3P4W8_9SPHN|nr:PilZ domain-containing protein [Qipengyuania marisflavi]TMM48047.1 PilZ domain-containing protein [Qipengyuania marisflavi]
MSSVDTRNVARDSLFLFAELMFDGQVEIVRVKVRNLSAGGMMAEAGLAVTRGDKVKVTLRNVGDVLGHVAWVQGNRFGVAFENQIDPILARAPASTSDVEAPRYARASLTPNKFGSEPGRIRSL